MTAGTLEFGPRRSPIRISRIVGAGACLFGAGMSALAILFADQGAFDLVFFGCAGLCAGLFGIWMLVNGSRTARLRAVVTPDAFHIIAHRGRRLVLQSGLAEATLPWVDVQGFTSMQTLNIALPDRIQTTYILYTKAGDFTLNNVQWDNLSGLVDEISRRTGRTPGEVAPERAEAHAEVEAGKRRVGSFQRISGWAIVIACAPLLLLVIVGGFAQGFSADVIKAAGFLALALSLGALLVRFYRK